VSRSLLAWLSAASLCVASGALAQPAFPHKYHVEEEELACAECHDSALDSRSSADNLLPDNTLCLDCHDEGDVRLDWPAAEREILFDHAWHIDQVSMECATCHQGLDDEGWRTTGYLPAMDDCMSCHNGSAAPRDCETCHTLDRALLTPDTHEFDWNTEHGATARMEDASCMPCHSVNECQECHDGSLLIEQMSLGAARQPPFAPQLVGSSGNIVQAVHGLNFRFLHGIEARGKGTDCVTCHELDSGDFCAECHNPMDRAGLRPAWHGIGNWVTVGVGSGGGRHGELARQDIETCAACHDNQGGDPACLQCHMDRTPGMGNDPRTHDTSFASDMGDGDFHDDDGAVCFTCHVKSNAPDAFCTYCHVPLP
jgi:hypothetical protein